MLLTSAWCKKIARKGKRANVLYFLIENNRVAKICNCCKLPDKEFTKDNRNKDGLQGICNDCKNAKRRLRYSENPEPLKERQKRYNGYALEKQKKHIEAISDTYVIAELKRGTELTTVDIRKHPELIEAKRQIIKNKRLIKNEKYKKHKRPSR